ncbi:MAG TPA: proton-conducting transporter membrane subunit [Gemmataceae bacterium]|nr:proton-conducting transporter membrane subunit [Gemmataceae bacterium]
MILLPLPWLEAAILIALIGAVFISRVGNLDRAWRWGVAFTAAVLSCTVLASLTFYLQEWTGTKTDWSRGSLQANLLGRPYLELDELNAPLVPAAALLHFLTAVATARTKMRRFSLTWSLSAEAFHLAKFGCTQPMVLMTLLTLGAALPLVELINRCRPTRIYVLHMSLFAALLFTGGILLQRADGSSTMSTAAAVFLLAAVLIRCGVVPAHCWITDWFENASFGIALLYVIPLSGVYAAIRLVLPIAPDWVLHGIGLMSLITAFYAASMALIQREVRRFFAYFFLSHASLVLVGLQLHTAVALTAALSLWFAVILSLGGFGLVLRALESRFGPLSLRQHYGLYDHSPMLALSFLLTGLASVGFPGTFGFVAADLLVEGALGANLFVGLVVIATGALNGIAIIRVYLLLFTGARHTSTVSLELGLRERIVVLTLASLILLGGVFPQAGISSRRRAADAILNPFSAPPLHAAESRPRSWWLRANRQYIVDEFPPPHR